MPLLFAYDKNRFSHGEAQLMHDLPPNTIPSAMAAATKMAIPTTTTMIRQVRLLPGVTRLVLSPGEKVGKLEQDSRIDEISTREL